MSWTSKWRMSSVRFMASRVIAKTSGRTSSRRLLEAFVLARAARLGQLAAALEVLVVELVVGRLLGLGGRADLVADLADLRCGSLGGHALEFGFECIGLVDQGWMRRSSRSFESTKRERNFMGA